MYFSFLFILGNYNSKMIMIIDIIFINFYLCSFVPTEVVLRSPGARMDEVATDVYCGMDSTVFITEMGRVFACGK